MRRFIAIPVLLALGPAVFSAPLLHFHGHENTDHFQKAHRGQALGSHTHLPICRCGGGPGGTVFITASEDDDDAVFLNWFQDNPHPAPSLEFVSVETIIVPPLAPVAASIEVPAHRSHDPPLVLALNPRPPPDLPACPGM